MKTYLLGSINTDFVISCPRIPAGGETISGSGFLLNAGGKGANQAVACARLGGKISMCGCVGDDLFGRSARERMAQDGVDMTFVRIAEDAVTGVAVILVENGENRIVLDAGANAVIDESEAEKFLSAAQPGDLFLTQGEIPLPLVEFAFREAKRKRLRTVWNPAPAKPEMKRLLHFVDLLIPNETELALLTGESDVEKGCRLLAAGGADVVVTLGGKGCYYSLGEEKGYLPCPKVETVDTTAAGDTFCGALAAELTRGEQIPGALGFALAAASLSVTKRGAQPSIPTRKEVEAFLNR